MFGDPCNGQTGSRPNGASDLQDGDVLNLQDLLIRRHFDGPEGAAAKLGIPRQTLDSKITALGIDKHQYKSR